MSDFIRVTFHQSDLARCGYGDCALAPEALLPMRCPQCAQYNVYRCCLAHVALAQRVDLGCIICGSEKVLILEPVTL